MKPRRHLPNGYWTRERVTQAIIRYHERYLSIPSATAFNPSSAIRLGHPEFAERFFEDGDYPYYGTVVRRFGSWNAAVKAAGFEPIGHGGRRGN